MKKAYICSPYRASSSAELDRNIEYAQDLTRKALEDGYVPITPHLYLTQCLDDRNQAERETGLAAGLELLRVCDLLLVGIRYGISEGMELEIKEAERQGMPLRLLRE